MSHPFGAPRLAAGPTREALFDGLPPIDRPADLSGFRILFGYWRRGGRRALLAVDARGMLALYEYPATNKGTGAEPARLAPARTPDTSRA